MLRRNELFKVMGIVGMKGNGRPAAGDTAGLGRRRWPGQCRAMRWVLEVGVEFLRLGAPGISRLSWWALSPRGVTP